MPAVLLATRNRGKVGELRELLHHLPVTVVSLADYPDLPDVVEDGTTMAENAGKKAVEASLATGLLTLADDSGLEVDALGGEPGVHSNRFMGRETTEAQRNDEILRRLEGLPAEKRTCRFRCSVALAWGGEVIGRTEGTCEGQIATKPAGDGGFGYDPIFFLPDRGLCLAQLSAAEKNAISHRGRAIRAAVKLLEEALNRLSLEGTGCQG